MRYILVILTLLFALNGRAQTYGCMIGNSTIAAGYGAQAVAYYMLSHTDSVRGCTINSIAQGSRTILDQRATFLALTDKDLYDWVTIEIGLNDMNPATTTIAQDIANLQSLVDTIRYWNPTCKIVLCTLSPARARLESLWGSGAYTKWKQINDAIMNRADTTANVLRVDARISNHTALLNDGNDNLAPAYDTGDHIHENDAGRIIIANEYRAVLIKLKLLTYTLNRSTPFVSGTKLIMK